MKKIAMVLLICTAVFCFAESLTFEGWTAWGGIKAAIKGNGVTLNGKVASGGYATEDLNPALKGKTVTLEIRNAGKSVFSEGRLIKITANKEDRLIRPANVLNLVRGEYVPVSVTRIEFTLPQDFDGKLGFVFYQAELRDLQITAEYK